MKIRKFVKEDITQVIDICKEVRDHHIKILGGYFLPLDDEMEKIGFLETLVTDKSIALVAEEQGIIYGYLLAEEKNSPYLMCPQVAHIANFGVKESFRHQGIGKMLMDAFYEYCNQKGINEIRLGVFNLNQDAYSFYQKYGFEAFEQRMHLKLNRK